jgi:hypothetical protein
MSDGSSASRVHEILEGAVVDAGALDDAPGTVADVGEML